MKIEQVLKITFLLIFTITAFSPAAFSRQGTLTGQVIDGFDNAVKDVEVKIKKTDFTTRTDENGQYRINFEPGKIVISFRKKRLHKTDLSFKYTRSIRSPHAKVNFLEIS